MPMHSPKPVARPDAGAAAGARPDAATTFAVTYFHGTRADLSPGDAIAVGHPSNFGTGAPLSWVYFTATLDAAIWGAELAAGEGAERIYLVEPTGDIEDDPNVTDRRFPGNPTRSYRSRAPLRILGEAVGWAGHGPEELAARWAALRRLRERGKDVILD